MITSCIGTTGSAFPSEVADVGVAARAVVLVDHAVVHAERDEAAAEGRHQVDAQAGLGFNGVLIDLQHNFKTCTNFQNLPKISSKIYAIVADFCHLRAVEPHPRRARPWCCCSRCYAPLW